MSPSHFPTRVAISTLFKAFLMPFFHPSFRAEIRPWIIVSFLANGINLWKYISKASMLIGWETKIFKALGSSGWHNGKLPSDNIIRMTEPNLWGARRIFYMRCQSTNKETEKKEIKGKREKEKDSFLRDQPFFKIYF